MIGGMTVAKGQTMAGAMREVHKHQIPISKFIPLWHTPILAVLLELVKVAVRPAHRLLEDQVELAHPHRARHDGGGAGGGRWCGGRGFRRRSLSVVVGESPEDAARTGSRAGVDGAAGRFFGRGAGGGTGKFRSGLMGRFFHL